MLGRMKSELHDYRKFFGVHFHKNTPKKLMEVLHQLNKTKTVVRLFYGDETGLDSLQQRCTEGRIRVSRGPFCVSILHGIFIGFNSLLMDHRIVKITDVPQKGIPFRPLILYQHPNYHQPEIFVDNPNKRCWTLTRRNNEKICSFTSKSLMDKWLQARGYQTSVAEQATFELS